MCLIHLCIAVAQLQVHINSNVKVGLACTNVTTPTVYFTLDLTWSICWPPIWASPLKSVSSVTVNFIVSRGLQNVRVSVRYGGLYIYCATWCQYHACTRMSMQLNCFMCSFVPHMDNAWFWLELSLCPSLCFIQDNIIICIAETATTHWGNHLILPVHVCLPI